MNGMWLAVLASASEGGGPASPFEVNFGLFFWTWLVFIALYIALKRFAWPAILRSAEERERRIQKQLDEAEQSRAEAARLLEEHRALLAGAQAGAQEIIAKAKSVAEKERETLLARSREEQEALIARARRDIDEEKRKAVLELRREAVDLAIAAAGRLVEQRLDNDANRRIVTEYLATIEQGR